MNQQTKLWLIPALNHLELFRAEAIHHTYTRHSHSGYSIGIIEAGVGGNWYRGSTYLAPPKSIVFINPEEVHTGYSVDDLPLTYRMFYPEVDFIQQLAGELNVNKLLYFKEAVVQNDGLARKLCQLHIALEQLQERLTQQSLLVDVFSELLVRYGDINIQLLQPGKEQRTVRLIQEYLHEHFSANISLEQLVELTNLNRSYLIRVFRKAVGMPPYTYLNQIRVEKAKQFLAQGMAVADVAIAVGMSDQSHLTRHFKRITGTTPGQYRRMSLSFKTI